MKKIGFSTGCLYKSGKSYLDMAGLYQDAGIDAIELSFPTIQSLRDFRLPKALEDSIRSFSHISIHAPWVDARYISNAETILAFNKLSKRPQSHYFKKSPCQVNICSNRLPSYN